MPENDRGCDLLTKNQLLYFALRKSLKRLVSAEGIEPSTY
jgi:hypothetical protein